METTKYPLLEVYYHTTTTTTTTVPYTLHYTTLHYTTLRDHHNICLYIELYKYRSSDCIMGFVKMISLGDDVKPMVQRMADRGVNFSAWVAEKIREEYSADTPFIVTTMEKLMNNDSMEAWQVPEKPKPNLASLLKTMSKEELEKTINDKEIDEITRSFARVFLKYTGHSNNSNE